MNKKLVLAIGIVAGMGLGYAYYALIGCQSGACPLQSNPLYDMALGGLIGWSISDAIFNRAANKSN